MTEGYFNFICEILFAVTGEHGMVGGADYIDGGP